MALVATLISGSKASFPLNADHAHKANEALGASLTSSGATWLATDIACDIAVPSGLSKKEAEVRLRSIFSGLPVDIAVQDVNGRRKKMLIADMDSTMIDQECIDELADEVGIKAHVAAITARAMNGEIAFEPALRERVALLKGLELAVIDRVIDTRITLAAGGKTLLSTMRRDGAHAALVSGGFDIFTRRISDMLGFHEDHANRLIIEDGRLSGFVAEPILGRQAKAESLSRIAAGLGITENDAIAVGDGANDLDMLQLAGTGVALHAKPAVAEQADIRIDHSDLTALLYLQGYHQEEFAA